MSAIDAGDFIQKVMIDLRDRETELRKKADACDAQFGDGAGAALAQQANAIDDVVRRHLIPAVHAAREVSVAGVPVALNAPVPLKETIRKLPIEHSELRMYGEGARHIIKNFVRLVKIGTGVPLWSYVSDLTGHGSGYSADICRSANLDPLQPVFRGKELKDLVPGASSANPLPPGNDNRR